MEEDLYVKFVGVVKVYVKDNSLVFYFFFDFCYN